MKVSILILLSFLAACSTSHQLNSESKKIEIYTQAPKDCVVVGKVVGIHDEGSIDLARNQAINKANKLGANGVIVNQEIPNGSKMEVFATAYKCDG